MRTLLLAVRTLLFAAAMLGAAGIASAQVPAVPAVPGALPAGLSGPLLAQRARVEQQRNGVLEAGARHNERCRAVKEGSPEHRDCIASRDRLRAQIVALRAAAEALEDEIDAAVALEKKRLTARDVELSAAIARDVTAIRRLGFDRRAEDFAEWEKLGAEARAGFEKEIIDSATDAAIAKVRGSLLEGFKSFDDAQAARWIGKLAKVDPRPVELIGLIERLAKLKDKAQIAESAELVLERIGKLQKTRQALQPAGRAQAREDLLLTGLDLVCDVVPPPGDQSCKAFKVAGKLTAASLYNNAARRVALGEVERLNAMTEAQLLGLARINQLMAAHIQDRNEVRRKLAALEP